MRRSALILVLIGISVGAMIGCQREKLPSRDQIPVIRARLQALNEGILQQDRAAIDSLLSVSILDLHEGADSLLRYVYGPDSLFPFRRLGDYDIFYTEDRAVIDCFIMDSAEDHSRPFKLTFGLEDTLWLLRRFEPGTPKVDSTADSATADSTEW